MTMICKVLAAFCVMALFFICFQYVDISRLKATLADERIVWQRKLTEAAAAALAESERVRKEQDRINATQKAELDAAHQLADSYRTDRDAASAARDKLQHRIAFYVAAARRASQSASAAAGSAATDDPIGVLADVLGRADARAELLAIEADKRGRAGQLCERDYDALTGK